MIKAGKNWPGNMHFQPLLPATRQPAMTAAGIAEDVPKRIIAVMPYR
jgi:hypothetical protein